MADVVYSEGALNDLDSIWTYTIERWSQDHAVRYLQQLRDRVTLLADHPASGRVVEGVTPEVRVVPCRSHVIVYRVEGETLRILAFSHQSSNWYQVLLEG